MKQFFLSSWRAGFRSRLLFAVFILGVALVGVAFLAASFSPRQPQTVALDVGLSGLRFTLVLFAIILTQELVGREIERRMVILTLAYPTPRAAYLLGRYFGVLALVGVATLILAFLLWIAVLSSGLHYEQQFSPTLGAPFWAAVCGVWFDVAVVAAFTLLISALSTVPALPLVLGLLFAIATRALGAVFDYLQQGADGQEELVARFAPMLDVIHWLIPDLSRLDWRSWSMYGVLPDSGAMVLSVVAAVCYAGVMLGLAIHVFSQREFA